MLNGRHLETLQQLTWDHAIMTEIQWCQRFEGVCPLSKLLAQGDALTGRLDERQKGIAVTQYSSNQDQISIGIEGFHTRASVPLPRQHRFMVCLKITSERQCLF